MSFPTTSGSTSLTTIENIFNSCTALTAITNSNTIGTSNTAAAVYVLGNNAFLNCMKLQSIDLVCKFSKFIAQGVSASVKSNINSIRLRNNGAGQYGGTSPQINISFTDMGQAALVQLFNDLPTITAKTINITSCTGAAALTPAERAIATGKGWTIVG